MTEKPPAAGARRPRSRAWVVALGGIMMLVGFAVLGALIVAPEQSGRAAGAFTGSVRQAYQEAVRGDAPLTVQLGPPGMDSAIDSAPDGTFPEMESYRVAERLQPVFAAHNGSGGDVILPLEFGDTVLVVQADGRGREMVVTDARDTPQIGATTADLSGMSGSLLLQTCYWDVDEMRFVALTPVGETPQTPAEADGGAALVVP